MKSRKVIRLKLDHANTEKERMPILQLIRKIIKKTYNRFP
jgi:hypothetical protein